MPAKTRGLQHEADNGPEAEASGPITRLGEERLKLRTFDHDPEEGPREEAEDLIWTFGKETARDMAVSDSKKAAAAGEIEKAGYYQLVLRLINGTAGPREL